jgi:hypothetical protein
VTLETSGISAGGEPGLFGLKTSVCVMAVTAQHGALEHLVVERLIELVLRFAVTLHTQLRFALHQHLLRREAGLLAICR